MANREAAEALSAAIRWYRLANDDEASPQEEEAALDFLFDAVHAYELSKSKEAEGV